MNYCDVTQYIGYIEDQILVTDLGKLMLLYLLIFLMLLTIEVKCYNYQVVDEGSLQYSLIWIVQFKRCFVITCVRIVVNNYLTYICHNKLTNIQQHVIDYICICPLAALIIKFLGK